MLGDLPIPIDETGRIDRHVEWADFAAFMKRLEHHVGGAEGLEACGEKIGEMKPARVFTSLAGFSASPYALYRAASLWALRRALPGVEAHLEESEPNRIEIHARIKDGLRDCPQVFHFATGGARALPRVLGLCDAVVSARVEDREAHYQIIVPPSQTLWARVKRMARTIFSASSVLEFLEAQQLELHAKHEALQRTHSALAASERRYRAMTDTAVDVLCELNQNGQIEYVSASIQDLLGYTPDQVTGSHFSLWVPARFREIAKQRLAAFASRPIEQPINRQRITLHTESGDEIVAELSLRSYRTPEGEIRMVGILRDQSETVGQRTQASSDEIVASTEGMTRVVENAMVQAPDDATNFRWLETDKLVDMVEYEFRKRDSICTAELELDLSAAPSAIWGDEGLLASGLGSLLDWAVEVSGKPALVTLRVESIDERAIMFSVAPETSRGLPEGSESEGEEESANDPRLALAERAANDLGGALMGPWSADGSWSVRIQLPQPTRPE